MSTEEQGQGGPDTELKPLPYLFPGLSQERYQPMVPQASPQVTSRDLQRHGLTVGCWGGPFGECISPVTGYLGPGPKEGKGGSWWFGGTSAGEQREKGIKGAGCVQTGCWSAACPAVPAPDQRCLSCLLPEHCFQPFLNMNKDA